MLHDHKDTRAIFGPLAALLQTPPAGRPQAAVVRRRARRLARPRRQHQADFPDGSQQNLDAAKIRKRDVYAMASLDMEEVRRFLVTKNDEGALNLNKLCLIGAGMGPTWPLTGRLQDWRVPPLAIGKQGQDVKALVMISPRWNFQGLSMQEPMRLRPLKEQAAWMLIYGSQDPEIVTESAASKSSSKRFIPTRTATAPRDRPTSWCSACLPNCKATT